MSKTINNDFPDIELGYFNQPVGKEQKTVEREEQPDNLYHSEFQIG